MKKHLSDDDLKRLGGALRNPDPAVRASGASELSSAGDRRSLPALIEALDDPDEDVCREIAGAIASIKDTRAILALADALASSKVELRRAASYALGFTLNDERVCLPALVKALGDPDPQVRDHAANTIGQSFYGDVDPVFESAVGPLMALLKDSDLGARQSAAFALWMLKRPAAADALAGALEDEDRYVKDLAANALAVLHDPRAFEPLIAALSDGQPHRGPCRSLAELGDLRAVESVIGALSSPGAELREDAVGALGQFGDDRAIEPLIARLDDPESRLRASAADSLGELKAAAAIEPLRLLLDSQDEADDDSVWSDRSRAIVALGEIGTAAVVPVLSRLCSSLNVSTRRGAVRALGQVKRLPALDAVLGAVGDSDASVRAEAAVALGGVRSGGGSHAYSPLLSMVQDPDREVRRTAIQSLVRLAFGPAAGVLTAALKDSDGLVCCTAAAALCDLHSDEAVPALFELLRSDNSHLRWHATTVVGEIGDETTLEALELLSASDLDPSVRAAAAAAVRRIGS
ncbi:MAG: HEAT repeat domain-containing protein, partial [Chloroflexi bacterium]|nr:HEAT repeat domain-containing protein [Chloroflexota bacterium]